MKGFVVYQSPKATRPWGFVCIWLMLVPGVACAQAQLQVPAAPPAELPDLPAPPNTLLRPGEYPIDLATALQLAGVENPELQLARERLTEAAAVRMLAAAQALPNINVGSNYDLHRGVLQQSNGNILHVNRDALYVGLGANAIAAGTVNIPGIQYNLNVGQAWFNYLRSQQVVARQSAATATAHNDVMLKVCLAYCELLRAQTARALAEKNREEMAEVARLTAEYARTGAGRKADADRAAVELRRREAELTQTEADILSASARLCRLLSLDPSTRLVPIDGVAVPTPVVPEQIPVNELIAIALMQRPELAERRAEIQEALLGLSSAELLPFSPNVISGLSSGAFGGGSDLISRPAGFIGGNGKLQKGPRFGNFDGRMDYDIVAYWTLQNLGCGNRAQIRIAASVARQANLRQVETLNRIRAEVAEAHARTNAKSMQVDVMASAITSSTEAFTEDLKRIRSGFGLPIEVIDSLRLLSRSRMEYLGAIIEYNQSQFQLYVAMGQPPANFLSRPVPQELIEYGDPPPVVLPISSSADVAAPGAAQLGVRILTTTNMSN